MCEVPLWNQFHLPCPATAAHKVDLTNHPKAIMGDFLKNMAEKLQELEELTVFMRSELGVLKKFLYKLAAVFAHDKSYKFLKRIETAAKKFQEADITSSIKSFHEQHTVNFTSAKVTYVAPKPKYEYVLVRLQGIVRLLAQILCYCQHYGSFMFQKMKTGHFVIIFVISISFAARIWALSFHTTKLLISLYDNLYLIYRAPKIIPTSIVSILPPSYDLPSSLVEWLKSDTNLKGIHRLFVDNKRKERSENLRDADIWQAMEVEADEREHLTQLKELVTATNLTQTEKFLPKVLDQKHSLTLETFLPSNPDIGEPVSREATNAIANKKKKKRAKKRKASQLEN